MTDKAREAIAEIVNSNIFFGSAGVSVGDAATISAQATDAILAALPEIIRQNPSIIADMVPGLVPDLVWEGDVWCQTSDNYMAWYDGFDQAGDVWANSVDEISYRNLGDAKAAVQRKHNVDTIVAALGMKDAKSSG